MTSVHSTNTDDQNRICFTCIDEPYLSAQVETEGETAACAYCEEEVATFTLEEMADAIEGAFERHFERTASEPDGYESAMMRDKEINYDWERDGEPTVWAIANAAGISEDAASDIQKILEDRHGDFEEAAMGMECAFSDEAHYEEILPGDEHWEEAWQDFRRTIKSEARFFSRTAASQLNALFGTIEDMRTTSGDPIIVDAGPDTPMTHLFRARVFQRADALEQAMIRPDIELSAPPSSVAAAGRMNAHGISVFYGATTVPTALAEVRPPVGSDVAVARFDIIRPLRLLNLNALGDVRSGGSIFDPETAYRMSRTTFLKKLSRRMAEPVLPDDQESEYLPTQAIADYLATEAQMPLDGIIFPSVQVDGAGLNVVLFHKAAKTRLLEFPEGTSFDAHTYSSTDDGPEPDYRVWEEVPPDDGEEKSEDNIGPFGFPYLEDPLPSDGDYRQESLAVDPASVEVHLVSAVDITTARFEVHRHRMERREPPF